MGAYVVRFKGSPIKNTSKDQPVDDDEEVVDVAGTEKKPKKKGKEPFAPEKAVVKNVFGVKDAKKEMIILDEKGSAKSGNYGHAGRAGKLGGSAPKAKGPVSGGQNKLADQAIAATAGTDQSPWNKYSQLSHAADVKKQEAAAAETKRAMDAAMSTATPAKTAQQAHDDYIKKHGLGVGQPAAVAPVKPAAKAPAARYDKYGFPAIKTTGLPKIRKGSDGSYSITATDSADKLKVAVEKAGFTVIGVTSQPDAFGGKPKGQVAFRDNSK